MVKRIGNYNIIPQLAPPISGMHNVHTSKNKISKPTSDYKFRSYSYTLQKGQKVRLPIPSNDHVELCHFNQVLWVVYNFICPQRFWNRYHKWDIQNYSNFILKKPCWKIYSTKKKWAMKSIKQIFMFSLSCLMFAPSAKLN
jgi:hypothetical protein